MTDDTGQPTVDRLAALEAALRLAIGTLVDVAPNEQFTIQRGQLALAQAQDAASPLTTPTPDQGALERAHAVLHDGQRRHLAEPIGGKNLTLCEVDAIAAALTAAASEARAAAMDQACRLCALEAVRANDRAVHAKPFSRETTDVWCATARELEDRIAALLTPEQSET